MEDKLNNIIESDNVEEFKKFLQKNEDYKLDCINEMLMNCSCENTNLLNYYSTLSKEIKMEALYKLGKYNIYSPFYDAISKGDIEKFKQMLTLIPTLNRFKTYKNFIEEAMVENQCEMAKYLLDEYFQKNRN